MINIDANQEIISAEVQQNLELVEASAWNEIYDAAGKFIKRDCGLQSISRNGTTLSVSSQIDVLTFNRVVGWGIKNPAMEDDLNFFKETYRKAQVPRFFVQVSPYSTPPETLNWLQQHGFILHNNWVKLYRESGPTPNPTSDFEIIEVRKEDAQTFSSIVTEAFQWPEQVNFLLSSLIPRKNWRHYLAYSENEPVATGSVFIKDEYAWFCFAATMPGYRAKGAQTALIHKRIEAAMAAGCKHIFVETADDKGGNPSPSGRNLMRMGFRQIYKRPNYIFYNKKKE